MRTLWPLASAPGYSSVASNVMVAFSKREMGQPARAASACSANAAAVIPDTRARVDKCTFVMVIPASVFSRVTVAVVLICSGG